MKSPSHLESMKDDDHVYLRLVPTIVFLFFFVAFVGVATVVFTVIVAACNVFSSSASTETRRGGFFAFAEDKDLGTDALSKAANGETTSSCCCDSAAGAAGLVVVDAAAVAAVSVKRRPLFPMAI